MINQSTIGEHTVYSNNSQTFHNSSPNDKILDWSKLKAFADDKINLTEKLKFVLGTAENIVGKGENAVVWEIVNSLPNSKISDLSALRALILYMTISILLVLRN